MTKANIDKIAQMFPQVVTEVADPSGAQDAEGKPLLKKAIDFEKLKVLLSAGTGDYAVVDDERERYEFTWVGKRQAMIDAATPIRKTLRPCPEESKDWATTENLYIEGDNLEVLKLLQESYLGKVKMIYIDPPYNTGKDFIYKDNFTQSREEYEEELGIFDDEGHKLFRNTETNGRFHSDWCSMIYPRLQLARNLLTDDGVIFISIDDNEVRNLKNICDEVFGESNFLANIVWQKKTSPDARMDISAAHDFILVYCKQKKETFALNPLPYDENRLSNYTNPDNDKRGVWASVDITGQTGRAPKSQFYEIITPSGRRYLPPDGRCWAMAEETFNRLRLDNRLWFGTSGENRPRLKKFLSESDGVRPWTWWDNRFGGHNQESNKELMQIFNNNLIFDNPKPLRLLKKIIFLSTPSEQDCITLDFFSGSATLAQAIMELNLEDGGKRHFICVQLPDLLSDHGNDYKANNNAKKLDLSTICEIGKERIRRAGAKIVAEQKAKNDGGLFADESQPLDTGFRVFKLDTTNMKDVYYGAGDIKQDDLVEALSNIKDGRSDIDLLYGCLLDWGVYEGLQLPHISETINGCQVHTVDDHRTEAVDLIACFDEMIPEETIRTIASRKPMRAVFRDSSFKDSADKINVSEIFKALSPDTTVKVI